MPFDPLPVRDPERPADADRLGRDVARFAHGSRQREWERGADPDKPAAEVPDPATTIVPAPLRAEIERHLAKYPTARSATIPALLAAQEHHGWCSPEAIAQAACVLRLTPAELAAVATFYDMLQTRPGGARHVYVCTNISCSLRGADELLARLQDELTGAEDVTLRGFECLGACDIAPMASVQGVYVGPIADEEVEVLADQIRRGADPLPERQLARRLVADPDANTRDWRALSAADDHAAATPAGDPRDTHLGPPTPAEGGTVAAADRLPAPGDTDPAHPGPDRPDPVDARMTEPGRPAPEGAPDDPDEPEDADPAHPGDDAAEADETT